jgi:enamine deaminase RidA (YjgF/YER057c/UK114 family)
MSLSNIVRINAFVTGREHLADYMAVRNALFAEPYPASTLMIVSGFARPEFVVEIEAIAAGPA